MNESSPAKEANPVRVESGQRDERPNILILCMDQWQTHMELPEEVALPALERLEREGTSFDRHYCTVPLCTPSRSTMWTGVHARQTGLWDNTNFAWIDELSPDLPTVGHMMRQLGYYTAFKGKWHCSEVPRSEDALERYGFSDYQQWGDMYGAPLQGAQLDGTVAFETIDWLENRAPSLEDPWLLVCSMVNPHDIMFFRSDPLEEPHEQGAMRGLQTTEQRLDWFEARWDVTLPDNFDDPFHLQPFGVLSYKETIEKNYGRIPAHREDLWLKRRNYLINAMRRVDSEFNRILRTLDRLELWKNTIVILTCDHGEMNGAHRLTQKGAIPFEEAAVVNFTVCVPDGPKGVRTGAVGSHLDLVPTLLDFAGVDENERLRKFPHLKGHSLKPVILHPEQNGPRGSRKEPGKGALICWDGLNMLDLRWSLSGALAELTDMEGGPRPSKAERLGKMKKAGELYGAPDFSKRTLFRAVTDGRYKLVRWFSPLEYGNPSTLQELYQQSDVALYDLESDPGELENLGHPDHPEHQPDLVLRLLEKLHDLIDHELGEESPPFDLDMFGTRQIRE